MTPRLILPVVVACALAALTGCASPGGAEKLKTECRQAVADYASVDLTAVNVTWSQETPGGALDWRGEYPGGTFACGAGLNPDELYDVIAYTNDGLGDVIR